jgi:hypothetical protein
MKKSANVTHLLSEVKDDALREKLERRFIDFETLKRMNVEAQRSALRAQANAMKTAAEVQLAQLDFLIEAAEAFELISTEPVWMIRRRGADGEVVLECLLTERDMQRMAHAQSKQMKDQIKEITGTEDDEQDDNDDGMFTKK